jgi:hypothetical protein
MKLLFSIIIIGCFTNLPTYSQNKVYREVILFYPVNKIDTASKQFKMLSEDMAGLTERQIKITRVATNTKNFEKYSSLKINPSLFTLVLIGKDGGEKFSSNKVITSTKLYSLIDQMPMRKQEMKNDNK